MESRVKLAQVDPVWSQIRDEAEDASGASRCWAG